MEQKLFEKFAALIYEKAGISLKKGKEALVATRLSKRMRVLGIESHRDYFKFVAQDTSGNEIIHLLDTISTNVTSFYRESKHFDFLTSITRTWIEEGSQRIRIWCAASSSGEEPYTIAMTLKEVSNGYRNIDCKILATDISTRILELARNGKYSAEKLETVPKAMVSKYFLKHSDTKPPTYSVKPDLKSMILFRRLNLSTPPFPMKGPLDAIFCRNVMIYFDNVVRTRLLDDMYRLLKPGGYLFVGHAESLTGIVSKFKSVQPSVYIK